MSFPALMVCRIVGFVFRFIFVLLFYYMPHEVLCLAHRKVLAWAIHRALWIAPFYWVWRSGRHDSIGVVLGVADVADLPLQPTQGTISAVAQRNGQRTKHSSSGWPVQHKVPFVGCLVSLTNKNGHAYVDMPVCLCLGLMDLFVF